MRIELENVLGTRGLRGLQAAGWMVVIAISFVLIRAGKDLFIPLVIALIGVYLIKILERWIGYVKIAGRGLPPLAALTLAFVAVIALSFVLFSIIADNAVRVAEFAPRYQSRLLAIQSELFLAIGFEQPPAIREFLGGFDLPGTVTLVATNLATLLKNAILILIFGVFLLLESRFIPAKIAALFPGEERRVRVQGILKRVDRDIQTYFGVKTAVSLLTAVLSYAVMKYIGLDFAAFWALLVFILNFIPTIGSIFATILPGLLALVQFEEWRPVVILVLGIRDVAIKEPWCVETVPVSDIGVLSAEAETGSHRQSAPDEGAVRALLEGHFLFELLDREMDFSRFKLLILPDVIRIDAALKARLDEYLAQGGRLLLTGESGLWKDRVEFAFDTGADCSGPSEYSPDFILPEPAFRADFVSTPVVMYSRSQRIRVTTGESLGQIYDPYFNRDFRHFCSHQHTPFREDPSGFDCGVRKGPVTYLAHPVFSLYRTYGAVVYREYISRIIASALGPDISLTTNLPSTARVSLNFQKSSGRHVLHLLLANTVSRGGAMDLAGGTVSGSGLSIEVIEELLPLRNTLVSLHGMPALKRVTLEPGGTEIPFARSGGRVEFSIDEFTCHQIVVLEDNG